VTGRLLAVRALLVLAAAGAVACGGKADSGADSGAAAGAGATAGSGDSASAAVVPHSVPPTAGDRALAAPATANTGADTNRSGMAVTKGAAAKDSQ
jgi:hypothetical protein